MPTGTKQNYRITRTRGFDENWFNNLSGIKIEDAEKFLKEVTKGIDFDGRAELFASGNYGWALYTDESEHIGNIMYDKTVVGLEDARQGNGWYFQGGRSTDTEAIKLRAQFRDAVKKIGKNYNKPYKPRL